MKKTIELGLILLALCLFTNVVRADFNFGTPIVLGPTINTSSDDSGPSMTTDGLELYLDGDRPGGQGGYDIWLTSRAMPDDPWGVPDNPGPPLNTSAHDFAPSISANGLELYFISTRGGGFDIWVTTRATISDPWPEPVNLGSAVNSTSDEMGPSISADGLELYFGSTRSGGLGRFDLWVTKRETIYDPWGEAVHLGSTVNSSVSDNSPCISPDGLMLFFESKRPDGYGDYDIWVTRRATVNDDWDTPVNLGPTINSALMDCIPCISPDGSQLYYIVVNHPEGFGGYDIWRVPIDPIIDLNDDGIVDAMDRFILMDHWGEDDPLCDIGPMPWGDGIVDMQDLLVLTEYLEPIDTLIAHWALDETEGITAHDSVSGNDDIIMGDPLWQPTGGKVDGALELDGVTDCIITATGPNPAEGPFSIFAWIKGGAPGQVIISQPLGSNWLGVDADDTLMTELKASGNGPPILLSQAVMTDDQWHHIGLVWDGSQRMLCADGVVVAQDTLDGLEASAGALYIGVGNNWAAGSFFSGLIDDVRLYCRALSAEDIAALTQ